MNEARIADDGSSFVVNRPVLEGVACEVQHPLTAGATLAEGFGIIGFGVVVLPTGQPRVVTQVKHADGTALHGTMKGPVARALLACLIAAIDQAQEIADAADKASRQ